MVKIKFSKCSPEAKTPTRATDSAAGWDVCAAKEVLIAPGETKAVPIGLRVELPYATQLEVRSRSGLAKSSIVVANSPGTIDPDFRGEIMVLLKNTSLFGFMARPGERIAQLVLMPFYEQEWLEVPEDELSTTDRGDAGFGSTGK